MQEIKRAYQMRYQKSLEQAISVRFLLITLIYEFIEFIRAFYVFCPVYSVQFNAYVST